MITEKQFALGFSGFWSGLLPMLERHIREVNLQVQRFVPPFASRTVPTSHGLVNELAFRLFVASARSDTPPSDLTPEAVAASIDGATSHIRHMRQLSRTPITDPTSPQLAEAIALAERHLLFFQRERTLTVFPAFPGCGWVMECAGDVLSRSTLFEVKAGQRGFRSIDVRQTLVYCALNFAAKTYDISTLCLVNPRTGTFAEEDLEDLCRAISGASAVETLAAIVEYCSESQDQYPLQ